MDFLAVFGIVFAFLAIFGSQYLEGGQLNLLFSLPALIIVLGGTIGAVMLQTQWKVFLRSFRVLKWVIFPPKLQVDASINKIVSWSKLARSDGLLALENAITQQGEPFLKAGIEAIIDGYDSETVRRIMETDLENTERFDQQAAYVFESMGGYSPTIGIMGAVLGLIQVMRDMNDPTQLGAGIAVAFVATIYGVGFANLLFLPAANKIKSFIYKRSRYQEMLIEGVLAIADGDHPRVIEKRLQSYIGVNRFDA